MVRIIGFLSISIARNVDLFCRSRSCLNRFQRSLQGHRFGPWRPFLAGGEGSKVVRYPTRGQGCQYNQCGQYLAGSPCSLSSIQYHEVKTGGREVGLTLLCKRVRAASIQLLESFSPIMPGHARKRTKRPVKLALLGTSLAVKPATLPRLARNLGGNSEARFLADDQVVHSLAKHRAGQVLQ
jgi:hypothetical protein